MASTEVESHSATSASRRQHRSLARWLPARRIACPAAGPGSALVGRITAWPMTRISPPGSGT